MKSTCTKHVEDAVKRKYPYLAIHENDIYRPDPMIVLFTESCKGVLISCNHDWSYIDEHPIGSYMSFSENYFIQYNGEVTLKNV